MHARQPIAAFADPDPAGLVFPFYNPLISLRLPCRVQIHSFLFIASWRFCGS
jgi:hypothetical protein